jgi:zinc transport system substrate-binding protein
MIKPAIERRLVVLISLLVCVAPAAAAEILSIYSVNYPLQYFAERIAGKHATVTFPAPEGVDPAFWAPDIETIGRYQQADLILMNGADYAKWAGKVSLPHSRLVNTSRHFKDQYLTATDTDTGTHSHGMEGEHSHPGVAFTTWLDFSLAARHASAIKDALVAKRPDFEKEIEKNHQALENDLLALDHKLKTIASATPERPLLASHPVYQYLARRYSLNIKSVLWEPDTFPSEEQWMELRQIHANHPAKAMLWEDQPIQVTLDRLRSMGIESVVFDPCANTCESENFLSTMQRNVDNLETILR